MNDSWSTLVVLLLRDTNLMESGQGRKNGATDPDEIFAIWTGEDINLYIRWSQSDNFLLHTLDNAWVHGIASSKKNVVKEMSAKINVTLHNGVVDNLLDAARFPAQ